jgi:quinol monooxygenase YgiN
MLVLLATIRIKPGTEAGIRAGAAACRAETLKEEGNISYDLTQSISDPLEFLFVERWKDREAITKHFGLPHFLAWRELSKDWVSERKIEIYYPDRVETL